MFCEKQRNLQSFRDVMQRTVHVYPKMDLSSLSSSLYAFLGHKYMGFLPIFGESKRNHFITNNSWIKSELFCIWVAISGSHLELVTHFWNYIEILCTHRCTEINKERIRKKRKRIEKKYRLLFIVSFFCSFLLASFLLCTFVFFPFL